MSLTKEIKKATTEFNKSNKAQESIERKLASVFDAKGLPKQITRKEIKDLIGFKPSKQTITLYKKGAASIEQYKEMMNSRLDEFKELCSLHEITTENDARLELYLSQESTRIYNRILQYQLYLSQVKEETKGK